MCIEYFKMTIKILKVDQILLVPKLCHPAKIIITFLKCTDFIIGINLIYTRYYLNFSIHSFSPFFCFTNTW